MDIAAYLDEKNISIVHDNGNELACLCPFHHNTDSPAFYINKTTGLWICFNPSCERKGSINDLMAHFGESRPIVHDVSLRDIEKNLEEGYEEDDDWEEVLDEILLEFPRDIDKASYLLDRGFAVDTIEYFQVGFSKQKQRIVVPARNEFHKLVGFIGRSVRNDVYPRYLYSKEFPKKRMLFNLNNAKVYESCIIVEGCLDAMKIHQAGFPNVVATLGAVVTDGQISLLRRFFEGFIIFHDDDDAGRASRDTLAAALSDRPVRLINYEPDRYPGKDAGELEEEGIQYYLAQSVDALEIL